MQARPCTNYGCTPRSALTWKIILAGNYPLLLHSMTFRIAPGTTSTDKILLWCDGRDAR